MSEDPATRYEAAADALTKRLCDLTEIEALAASKIVLAEAKAGEQGERDLTMARDRLEGAALPPKQSRAKSRLDNLREREPNAAQQVDTDFAWLEQSVTGFARWPFHERVRHWLCVSGADRADASRKSRRGSGRTWPGLEEAACFLLDWHMAAKQTVAGPAWLARALKDLDPNLSRTDVEGIDRARKLAVAFRRVWSSARTTSS